MLALLAEHAVGRRELTATQLRAIDILLRRLAPEPRVPRPDRPPGLRHEDALAELD
jgi:hypothetical protein